jgi:hypothetical protein
VILFFFAQGCCGFFQRRDIQTLTILGGDALVADKPYFQLFGTGRRQRPHQLRPDRWTAEMAPVHTDVFADDTKNVPLKTRHAHPFADWLEYIRVENFCSRVCQHGADKIGSVRFSWHGAKPGHNPIKVV